MFKMNLSESISGNESVIFLHSKPLLGSHDSSLVITADGFDFQAPGVSVYKRPEREKVGAALVIIRGYVPKSSGMKRLPVKLRLKRM